MKKEEVIQYICTQQNYKNSIPIKDKFSYVWLTEYSKTPDLEWMCRSITMTLPDWEQAPNLRNIQRRFKAGSKVLLQYYNGTPVGWFWLNESLTYDWIKIEKDLPTEDSAYSGGAFVTKNTQIPFDTGSQLYAKFYNLALKQYKAIYGYVDVWNKPPIKLNVKLGASPIDYLL